MKRHTSTSTRCSTIALFAIAASLCGCEQSSHAYFTATSAPRADIDREIERFNLSLEAAAKAKKQAENEAERKTIEAQEEDLRTKIKGSEKELEALPEKQKLVSTIVRAMFGTPDKPIVLSATGLDIRKIRLAAGPTTADENGNTGGLYRRHCVHCHGVTGNGAGPTAEFLNPYPRDFRRGWFKFKSTGVNEKPTDDDLRRTLHQGINGTAMPSFKLLPAAEVDALVEYVKYLSIRGEVEYALLEDYENCKTLLDAAKQGGAAVEAFRTYVIDTILLGETNGGGMTLWNRANERIVEVVPRPDVSPEESIQKGREIFYGVGGCVKCHGESAMGDGQIYYVNDIDAQRSEPIKPMVNPSLPMQALKPRNLRYTVIRGFSRDIDLYRRLRNGIDAVGMPAPTIPPEQVWHLVDYVKSLPYEFIEPETSQVENKRAN
ncbi:MAG: c-type cytochrome [Pirellulales bacterium]